MEETILVAKRSADVAPGVNHNEHLIYTLPPMQNKAAHSDFETQRRYHQNSKISVPTKKDLCPPKYQKT